ncbi:unnamed protein product [Caenorhabditis bovis]|uniref:F-box domain-containing protein n=1 Tax=Caenorhabditis bovis TaxID=2654633 RepID=A0A8S1F3J2_9PELO|nr:unnamed protein product [Caenorhabditis bovis]
MAMILRLPNEILIGIAEYLDWGDRVQFSRCNFRLHQLIAPICTNYESISVKGNEKTEAVLEKWIDYGVKDHNAEDDFVAALEEYSGKFVNKLGVPDSQEAMDHVKRLLPVSLTIFPATGLNQKPKCETIDISSMRNLKSLNLYSGNVDFDMVLSSNLELFAQQSQTVHIKHEQIVRLVEQWKSGRNWRSVQLLLDKDTPFSNLLLPKAEDPGYPNRNVRVILEDLYHETIFNDNGVAGELCRQNDQFFFRTDV